MIFTAGIWAVVFLLAILKAYGLHPAMSDENIYFYLATRVADGQVPYSDFTFAHPPIHLLLAVPVALLTHSISAFKMIPVAAVLIATVALGSVGKAAKGDWSGVLTALAFATAHDVLRSSSHFTGTVEATAFVVVGWALLRRKPVLAGVLMGLGTGVALYVAPAAAGILAGAWLVRRDGVKQAALGAAGAFLAWNLLGLLMGGGRFLDDVYGYHLAKTESEDALAKALLMVGFHQTPLLLAPLPAALALYLARRARVLEGAVKDTALCALCGITSSLVFLALQPRVFHFYLLPVLALCAPLLGMALVFTADHVRARHANQAALLVGSFGLVWAVHAWMYRSLPYAPREWNHEKRYTWIPAPLPGPFNDVIKALFWRDVRTIGSDYTGITYALWHESLDAGVGSALVPAVASLTPQDGTIFGDSLAAPLAAVMANRRIAADLADTNMQRFASGKADLDGTLQRALADNLRTVVIVPGQRLGSHPRVLQWLRTNFRLAATHPDGEKSTVELWQR